jgi:carbamoyl-phosphate synthase large subunit
LGGLVKRVIVSHSGSRIGIGFCKTLKAAPEPIHVIGIDSDKYHIQRSVADEIHLVPRAKDEDFIPVVRQIAQETGADFLWVQHEAEIAIVSEHAPTLGIRTFLPKWDTVIICQDKMATYDLMNNAGVTVPPSLFLSSPEDLRRAFREIGQPLWLRAIHGAGGRGSLPVTDEDSAFRWIDMQRGWGRFMAAKRLQDGMASWECIWRNGRLLAAQGRKRLYWEFSHLTPSGVTGVGGAHQWINDPVVDDTGLRAIKAIDSEPNGVFSVDMVYDEHGRPNVTEINVGRFMSGGAIYYDRNSKTNFPYLAVQAGMDEVSHLREPLLNPLPRGSVLIHGMDTEPVLVPISDIENCYDALVRRRQKASAMSQSSRLSPSISGAR